MHPAVALEPASLNQIERLARSQPIQNFHQRFLTLVTDHDIHKVFAESFGGEEARMPSAVDNRHFGPESAHHSACFDGVADPWAGQQRNAETGAVRYLRGNSFQIVRVQRAVDNYRLISGFPQGS